MTMQKYKPRRYEESDLDKIERLHKTHFEPHHIARRKLIFDWVARCNPAAGNESCYLVIEDDGRIVAYEGRMPVDLMVNGTKERGYFFHDTLVDPEYRKKGLGLAFVSNLKNAWEDVTDTFAVGIWANEFTCEILKRRGYYQLDVYSFVKPVNVTPMLKKRIKNKFAARVVSPLGRGLISMCDYFLCRRRYPDISISRIIKFDRCFDTFAKKISRQFPLIVLRHSRYMNWKYVDRPFANHALFTAKRNGELAGCIVLLSKIIGDTRAGVIVDILAAPDDTRTIAALCQTAVNYFKQEGVNFIACVLTNKNFIKVFTKHLFFRRSKAFPVMIADLQKHHAQELITDTNNWFLTFGDSDGFVWP